MSRVYQSILQPRGEHKMHQTPDWKLNEKCISPNATVVRCWFFPVFPVAVVAAANKFK